jgi:hypothetical protein
MPTRAVPLAVVLALLASWPETTAQCPVATLQSAAPGSAKYFGNTVAVDGDRIAVGTYEELEPGVVTVFRREDLGTPHDPSDDVWEFEAEIPSPFGFLSYYGHSLALDDDRLLIGAASPFDPGSQVMLPGVALMYRRVGQTWVLEAELHSDVSYPDDGFGGTVDLRGDDALVFARNPGSVIEPTAYVFHRDDHGTPDDPDDDSWDQQAALTGDDGSSNADFGHSLAIDGDRAIVSAKGEWTGGSLSDFGFIYVYERAGTAWSRVAKIGAAAVGGGMLGYSIALDGDRVLATLAHFQAGAEHATVVLEPDGTGWVKSAELKASDFGPQAAGSVGDTLALDGDVALCTAYSLGPDGYVYVFRRVGGAWSPAARLTVAGEGEATVIVDIQGSDVVVGDSVLGRFTSGLAHVFALESPPWIWMGNSLPAFGVAPSLFGAGTLRPNTPVSLSVQDGKPGGLAFLVFGTSTVNAPFKGGTLVPTPDRVVPIVLDGESAITLASTWPDGVGALTLYLQAWIADDGAPFGFTATNALSVASL